MTLHHRDDGCLEHVVVPFPALVARKGAAGAQTPTAQEETRMSLVSLGASLSREEVINDLADRVITYWPVTIGVGPYDLDVTQINPCGICGEAFTRPAFAFGFWHRISRDFVVLHARCLREAEEGVLA